MFLKHVPAATKGHLNHGINLEQNSSDLWLVWVPGSREPGCAAPLLLVCVPWECKLGPLGWGRHLLTLHLDRRLMGPSSCLWGKLVPWFGAFWGAGPIPKDVFGQKMFTALCCGLVWNSLLLGWQGAFPAGRKVAPEPTAATKHRHILGLCQACGTLCKVWLNGSWLV